MGEDGSRKYGSKNGSAVIAAPGTPFAIGGEIRFKRLTVQAMEANVGNIKIGGENLAPGNEIQLTPLSTHPYKNGKLSYIFIDGANIGDGITFEYEI